MRSELDAVTARNAAARRREKILRLLQEHNLPLPTSDGVTDSYLISPRFIETLMQAADDDAMRQLVEERAALVRTAANWKSEHLAAARPRSRDQVSVLLADGNGRVRSAAEFAAAVRG